MFGFTAFSTLPFSTYQITVTPHPFGGDDGGHWTKEEIRRIQKLQQKIAERQRKLEQATKEANASRKQAFRDQIDPVAKVKQTKVQLKQEVKADIPLAKTEDLQRSISYLERQRDNILAEVAYRKQQNSIENYLRIMEAKRLEELDDEEALLLLLH